MQILKYVFQQHGDERGQLVALEELKTFLLRLNVFTICMIQAKVYIVVFTLIRR